jgi:hypothetical protein
MWCSDTTLKVAFPALFGTGSAKDTSIANNLEFLGGSNQWNVSFVRRMIERWMFSLLFSWCCIQLKLEEVVKISFSGSLLKNVCLRSSLSSSPWLVLKVLAFLGRC